MKKNYGDFNEIGNEFIINTPDIERNWYNYLFNENYITFTSQVGRGEGFLRDELDNRLMPVKERGMYAVSGGAAWNLAGLPAEEKADFYSCAHGIGYTVITLERHGIRTEYGLFVPDEKKPTSGYEVAWVKTVNRTEKDKKVKIISYCENDFDGRYRYQGYNVSSLKYDKEINAIHYGVDAGEWNGVVTRFEGFLSCGEEVSGYDCARNAFIGPYGSTIMPRAVKEGGCRCSESIAEKCCYALEVTLNIAPGEEKFVSFVMGVTVGKEEITKITKRFDNKEKIENELKLLSDIKKERFGKTEIKTPNSKLDKLLNFWLKQQTDLGSRFARVRHRGFRDTVSDCECLAAFAPALAWRRLCDIMSYQYSNGYAPRTIEEGAIRDNAFSDNTVWLTFAVHAITAELGDIKKHLEETVPFNDGSEASVYEHLRRSVSWLFGFTGLFGLVKIWRGDWNDCMDRVGKEGKGVSIWLSIAAYRANNMLGELAEIMGDEKEVALCRERGEKMRALILEYGYDKEGGYFIYAINDDGRKICSSEEIEGKVHIVPQIWAVLSGISDDGVAEGTYLTAEKLLYDELGTKIMAPPYTHYDRGIGAIGIKYPGVQENGGVYLHPMCWKLAVDSLLKRSDAVAWDISRILPFENPVVAGRAEPYIICNSYNGKETGYRYGTPGQSWRTASGQWFLKAMLTFVFGIRPTKDDLCLDPCLPEGWDEAQVTKEFRGCLYKIQYRRTGIKRITVDGRVIDGNLLPLKDGECEIIYEF